MGLNNKMMMVTARLSIVVSLSAVLAACANTGPSVMVFAPEVETSAHYSDDGLLHTGTATAVPRVFLNSDQVEDDAPDIYTVVRGDTLWDISDRFLKEPWRWTEIWSYNEQIYNPHLIYPGDVLALEYVNGKPTLSLTRQGKRIPRSSGEPSLGAANPETNSNNSNGSARIVLSPQIRTESLDDAIPTISRDSIAQFLVHPRVVDQATLATAPYIVANNDNRLISSIGSKVYARGQFNRDVTSYSVFRQNKPLIDPDNGQKLGVEIVHVSDAKLLNVGDPSTLGLTRNKMETIAGDILLPVDSTDTSYNYTPRLPVLKGEGRIVSLVNAISQTGKDQVVVLNVGSESGVQEGDVLAVETRGLSVIDSRGRSNHEHITLPNQRTGVLMVFKTFGKVSYALVMESTRPLKINDVITGI